MVPTVRNVWKDEQSGTWIVGATLCLSCLLEMERFDELAELLSLRSHRFWHFDKFGAEALVRQGKINKAIDFAEAYRDDRNDDIQVVEFCERVLIEAGRSDEAYRRYALDAARATTNLAVFRKVVQKYPNCDPRQVLLDLVEHHGNPGKWFAAAKSSGFLDLAAQFANNLGAEPATLIRAARDFTEKEPGFAVNVGLCAIKQLLAGYGYESTTLDIRQAHKHLMTAAANTGRTDQTREAVEAIIARGAQPGTETMLEALSAQHRCPL
jgi:hypothetical protein